VPLREPAGDVCKRDGEKARIAFDFFRDALKAKPRDAVAVGGSDRIERGGHETHAHAHARALGEFSSETEQEHEQDKEVRMARSEYFNRLLAVVEPYWRSSASSKCPPTRSRTRRWI
jgi:hypothetical protein